MSASISRIPPSDGLQHRVDVWECILKSLVDDNALTTSPDDCVLQQVPYPSNRTLLTQTTTRVCQTFYKLSTPCVWEYVVVRGRRHLETLYGLLVWGNTNGIRIGRYIKRLDVCMEECFDMSMVSPKDHSICNPYRSSEGAGHSCRVPQFANTRGVEAEPRTTRVLEEWIPTPLRREVPRPTQAYPPGHSMPCNADRDARTCFRVEVPAGYSNHGVAVCAGPSSCVQRPVRSPAHHRLGPSRPTAPLPALWRLA